MNSGSKSTIKYAFSDKNELHWTVVTKYRRQCPAVLFQSVGDPHVIIMICLSFQGLKANMKRLYQLITEQQFSRCHKQDKYKKLLFSLCFFHSVLLERRKFLMLGWNIQYGFNDSDFEVSENLLSIYLDEYEETPWDALKYLVRKLGPASRKSR